jgi:hypothetical protein
MMQFKPWRPALCMTTAALAVCAAVFSFATSATAVTISGLKGSGFDPAYGNYAPGGDCSKEPRITLGDRGITFRANGRELTSTRLEYAVSYMGPRYEGITQVIFPFPVNDNDFGRVLMFVNDDERRGIIRFEADLVPGQRADPFHAAFTGAGVFRLCGGSAAVAGAPARSGNAAPSASARPQVAAQATPAEWTNLASLVGRHPGGGARDGIDILDKGTIAASIQARMGAKMAVLKRNLSVITPLQRSGNLYYLSGNAEHQGGEEQAYIVIDPTRRAVQVGLWERGRLTVYPPQTGGRLPIPPELKTLLDNSPPENAVALPGTPWELVPVQGRAPIAYVSAAGSPNIEALSLYCQSGKPFMAMLLNKPAAGTAKTMTWNFAGRLVNIPVQRANSGGTQWIGGATGTQLIPLLMQQTGTVMLRIDGRLEGEASLSNAPTVLRTALRDCVRL